MLLPPALCFNTPISVKVTSSGEDGWECEEGDCVWYPLEGLPGLGLELPEEPAYRMTPPANEGKGGHEIPARLRPEEAHLKAQSSVYIHVLLEKCDVMLHNQRTVLRIRSSVASS